jgi:glycosyltransferase involved in cell wall biosynthesis
MLDALSHTIEPARQSRGVGGLAEPASPVPPVSKELRGMRVAIVHYWLVGMRGGEKVLEGLCELFPSADIFTHVYEADQVSPTIRNRTVRTTFIQNLPRARLWYKYYLPLMPLALEQLDLRGYDLIISSESGPAKGVLAPVGAPHICYCHTPMRYIWNLYTDYLSGAGPLRRIAMPWLAHWLRQWDVTSAARVDRFVANSRTTAARIKRYYGRESVVVYPPVDLDSFAIVDDIGDFFLFVGELVPYKRPELAVEACSRLGLPLVVIGGGEMLEELRRRAGPTVRVLGRQPFDVLKDHLQRCRALIFPGEEDFGIVPVEALACGRPVVALARGGALETAGVAPGCVLFDEPSVEGLVDALRRLDRRPSVPPRALREFAQRFSRERFLREMERVALAALAASPIAAPATHRDTGLEHVVRAAL